MGVGIELVIAYAATEYADASEYIANLKESGECTRSSDQIFYKKPLILGDLNAVIGMVLTDHLPSQIGKAAASDESRHYGLLLAEFVTEHKLNSNILSS